MEETALMRKFRELHPDYPSLEEIKRQEEEQEQRRQEELERYQREAEERHHRYMLLHENIPLFFRTEGLYAYDPEGRITSQALYEIYKQWCLELKIPLQPPRAFWLHAKNNAPSYQLVYSVHIPDGTGKRSRGFYGIRALKEAEKSTTPE